MLKLLAGHEHKMERDIFDKDFEKSAFKHWFIMITQRSIYNG